ncbi:hypothetical protein [uncultured Ruminococcus sp.]|uniref:hypothetical protein n=1 Tax=uncultured Ruminococcus sp. TaxID=165186 RepID=UPI002931BF84|nr:hypothetical protein [uncultured Ruminococcus sp.]
MKIPIFIRRKRSVKTLTPRDTSVRGSRLESFPRQEKTGSRRCVSLFSGGGQEIRNNPNSLSFYFSLVQKPHNQAVFEKLAFQIVSVYFIFTHKIMSKL